jgi:hypothetical protein
MAWGGFSASAVLSGVDCKMVCLLRLGGLRAAAVGVPKQGAGWPEAGRSARAVLSGAECTTVWLLRGVDGARVGWQPWLYRGRWLGGVGWDELRELCWVAWSARQRVAERGCTGQSGGGSCGVPSQGAACALEWDSVRARRGRAGWCGVRSTACCMQRAACHHADVLWAATRVPVLVQEVQEPQGRRGCVGWSHQFKRVPLGRAGQCLVGNGCPGLRKRRSARRWWDLSPHSSLACNTAVGVQLVHRTTAPIMAAGLCLALLQVVLQVVGIDVKTTSPRAPASIVIWRLWKSAAEWRACHPNTVAKHQ